MDYITGYDYYEKLETFCEDDWKDDEKYYWKTKEGEYIKVDDLQDGHVENIVYLFGKQSLERNGYRNIIERFEKQKEGE